MSMKTVIDQFVSNDKSMKQSSRPITRFPVVTICLKSDSDYNFELGYDFDLYWDDKILLIEDTNLSHKDEFEPRIIENRNYWDEEKPVPTIVFQKKFAYLSKDACYQIKEITDFKEIKSEWRLLEVKFNHPDTLPHIHLYFTSENNADGAIFSEWVEGEELKLEFDGVSKTFK